MRWKYLTLATALAVASMPSHGEDLLDALQQATANDPVLAQAGAQLRSVQENVPQARAQLLPQISAGMTLSQASGNNSSSSSSSSYLGSGSNYLCNGLTAGTGTYDCSELTDTGSTAVARGHTRTRDVSATLNQTIFNMAKFADLKAAHAQVRAQNDTYDAALQSMYVNVATAYFNVLTDEDALQYAKASEDAYRRSYDQASAQFKAGVAAITASLQAKASYEAAKAQTITAQNTLDDAREALRQLTDQPVGTLKKLRDEIPLDPPTPNDPQDWVRMAQDHNPTLAADRNTVEAADHDISAARAGHLPTISATITRGKDSSWFEHGSSADISGNGRYGTTIGVTLSVPIFSGGAIQSQVRQSIANRDEAQDSAESDRRQVVRNTLNYYRSVLAGISEVQSARASLDASRKSLEATRAGYGVGTQTMTDVLLAIQTLSSSENSYSQARHQLVLDELLLKQAAGTIGPQDMAEVNSLLQ